MDLREERDFCSDFKCCDVKLYDLHALYHHLENCHQGSDFSDLTFSVPCSGPSSTGGAFPEVLQIPPPPSSPRKIKDLFTRVPLPPIPPISPITSDPSSAPSASTPEQSSLESSSDSALSSRYSGAPSSQCSATLTPSAPVFQHFQGPSAAQIRDKLYTPITVPPTLRQDQPPSVLSWSVSSPASFYPEAVRYGYGYCYYPVAPPVPHPSVPVPVSVLVPMRARGPGSAVPRNIEVIDVDSLVSPSASTLLSPPPSADPGPSNASAPPNGAPPPPSASAALPAPVSALPPPPPPMTVELPVDAAQNADAYSPPPPAERHCNATTAPTLAALRHRFFGFGSPGAPYSLGEDRVSGGQHDSAAVDADTAGKVVGAGGEAADRIASVAAPGERDAEAQGGAGALALNEDNIERQALVEGAEAEVLQTQDVLKEGRNEMDVDVDGAEDPGMDGAEDGDEDGDADSDADTDAAPGDQLFRKPILYIKGQEKPYVCPTPLCIKAYLNPNGLRYHKQKGTCVMENGQPCALFDANVATTSEALRPPKAGRANRRIAQPKQRPAGSRQSARLASLSSAAAAKYSSTRGSVKARSKTKTKAQSKSTPKSKPSRPSPASAASPTPSYSFSRAADFDQSDSDSDSASDFDSEMSVVDSD